MKQTSFTNRQEIRERKVLDGCAWVYVHVNVKKWSIDQNEQKCKFQNLLAYQCLSVESVSSVNMVL